MLFIKAVLPFLLILYSAKSDVVDDQDVCYDYYRDMTNTSIDVTKYCHKKLCITKCCAEGENLNLIDVCMKSKKLKRLASQINYAKIPLYSWGGTALSESKKNLSDFVFVHNQRMVHSTCTYEHQTSDFYILEDGSLKVEYPNDLEPWIDVKRLDFCIDFRVVMINNTTRKALKLVLRENLDPIGDTETKSNFIAIGMLISCFFMLLVFVVYCLLRHLRNIVGLILMAYTASLFVTYLIKSVLALASYGAEDCKLVSPFVYFAAVSSFFWLNVMSFDVWWTLRGNRKCREIHRRGELVKFAWYCLYAWGIPLLMAIGATILDNIDLTNWPGVIKPPFEDCFVNEGGVFIYLNIPIAIITVVNILLFGMTAFNIWQIKRGINKCQDSKRSEQDTYRFIIYVKLSVMMGVSWCLELIPDVTLWLYIMVNLYNVLIGVVIFFCFVFKKKILLMLCKRFNIQNDFVEKMQASMHSRSGTTRTTGTSSTFKSSRSQVRDSQV